MHIRISRVLVFSVSAAIALCACGTSAQAGDQGTGTDRGSHKSQNPGKNQGSTKQNNSSKLHAKAAKKSHKALTEKDAVRIVSERAEVKRWKAEVTSAKAKARGVVAQIELDRKEGGKFVVHVYEDVPDDAESSHTATLNWYYVDEKTGKVTTDF